jgi:hypothetical protein
MKRKRKETVDEIVIFCSFHYLFISTLFEGDRIPFRILFGVDSSSFFFLSAYVYVGRKRVIEKHLLLENLFKR